MTSPNHAAKKFMPLHWCPRQIIHEPVVLNEGAIVMFELSANVFVPGARAWADIVGSQANLHMVALFVFLLDRCADIKATVYLETLVNETDFFSLHGGVLTDTVSVIGYRLWVPLKSADIVSGFLGSIRTYLCQPVQADDPAGGGRAAKRARRASGASEESDHVQVTPKISIKSIKTVHALHRAVKQYFVGKDFVGHIDLTQSGDIVAADWSADDDAPVGSCTFVDYFSAERQFSNTVYVQNMIKTDILDVQRHYESYVVPTDTFGGQKFMPPKKVIDAGLFYVMRCGHGAGVISTGGAQLFDYFFPKKTASRARLIGALESILSAAGIKMSIGNKPIHELIRTVQQSVSDLDHTFEDPVEYSDLVEPSSVVDMDNTSDVPYSIRVWYHVISNIAHQTSKKRDYYSHPKSRDPDQIHLLYKRLCIDVKMLFSNGSIPGIPKIYNELYIEHTQRHEYIHTRPSKPDVLAIARKHFFRRRKSVPGSYTGLSEMIRFLHACTVIFRLMPQQINVFVMCYLYHFSATLNSNMASTFIILYGPPETGKSTIIDTIRNTVASCLCITEDSTSELASTVQEDTRDLRLICEDELRDTIGEGGGKNDSGTTKSKNDQTILASGVTTHDRVGRNAHGEFVEQSTTTVKRIMKIAGTNYPDRVRPAIASRAIMVPVVMGNATKSKKKHASTSSSIAVSTFDNPRVKQQYAGVQHSFQSISAAQINYVALEAMGGIPHIDMAMFYMYHLMYEARFGVSPHKARRTKDMKQLAKSLHIFDMVTTWHCRGLGAVFDYDPAIELMWYASQPFVSMEKVVIAVGMVNNTSSTKSQLSQIMATIRNHLDFADNEFLEHGDGHFYVTKFTSIDSMVEKIGKFLPTLGVEVVRTIITQVEATTTATFPNILTSPIDGKRGNEWVCVNKDWISQVITPVEAGIINMFKRMVKDPSKRLFDFDTESKHVFRARVHDTLMHPHADHGIPELGKIDPTMIAYGYRLLLSLKNPATKEPYVVVEQSYPVAVYTSTASSASHKLSKTRPNTYIYPQTELNPIVVDPALFAVGDVTMATPLDRFHIDVLTVAGGYSENGLAFSGLPSADYGLSRLNDCYFRVPHDNECSFEVYNAYACPKVVQDLLDDNDPIDVFPTAGDAPGTGGAPLDADNGMDDAGGAPFDADNVMDDAAASFDADNVMDDAGGAPLDTDNVMDNAAVPLGGAAGGTSSFNIDDDAAAPFDTGGVGSFNDNAGEATPMDEDPVDDAGEATPTDEDPVDDDFGDIDSLLPPDQTTVFFDQHSAIESVVAKRARSRVALPKEYTDIFDKAYYTY